MIAVFGKRGPDGRFLPGETFEFKRPGEENGEPVIDAFARCAAERYRREQEQKEDKRNGRFPQVFCREGADLPYAP